MIAITGATGHLGQTLLRQMRSRGDTITAAIRGSSNKTLLEGYCDRVHIAALDNTDGLATAFDGAHTVIHSAALIDIRRGSLDAMRRVNVAGTENVMQACIAASVKRLVYVGSIEAFDLTASRRPIREDFGFARGNAVMDYGETKAEACRRVTAMGLSGNLETVIVCPTSIVGPWDYQNGLITSMLRRMVKGHMPAYLTGGFDYVDVRDTAGAILAAGEKGRSGESYLVSGTYRTVKDLLTDLDQILGVRSNRRSLPLWFARAAAEITEMAGRAAGREVLFTRGSVEVLQVGADVDSSKAAEELGFQSRPLDETLRDTLEWITRGTAVNPEPVFV